jgi:formyltetrahydrofolate-dependent phosphoribosylglycinamide formyltransferase
VPSARLVVLASGSGTNLQAILEATDDPAYGATVVAVGTDRRATMAETRARHRGIPTFTVELAAFSERSDFDRAVAAAVAEHGPDLLVLAGYQKILGPVVVDSFPTVNTHPALLPAFPGSHAVRDALAAGVRSTGASVHWVDHGVDTGPVIAQVEVGVEPGDDEDSLRERIQAAERPLFVMTIGRIARGETTRGELP